MREAQTVQTAAASDRSLVRAMTRWDLAALAINGIVGAGIFVLPSSAARLLGVLSPIAFVLCAAITYIVVLCFAEVASHFSHTGGPYLYAREAFGSFAGFEIGWATWLGRVSSFAANTLVLVSYLAFLFPQVGSGLGRALILVAVPAGLTIINIRGVAAGARFADVFAAVKIGALIFFAAVGIAFVDWGRLAADRTSFSANASWGQAILLLIYAFVGFEGAVVPAAEARNPRKDLASALMLSLGVCAVIYVVVQIVALGTVRDLASSQRPLADSARNFLGPAAGALMSLLVCISVLGNLSASALGSPRITFALAERGDFPAVFGRLHPVYRTPAVSIGFFGAVAAILALSGTFVWLATASVVARLAGYLATCLALPVLRKRSAEPQRKIKWGPAVSAAGALLCVWLLTQAESGDLRAFALAAAAGAVLYVARKKFSSLAKEVQT